MDFRTWYEEADIPMQDGNGNWYDAETGIPFSSCGSTTQRLDYRNSKHAADIKAARQEARDAGWPDLTGTTKQQWWAIQVRRDLIASLPETLRRAAANMSTSASWWIDQRNQGKEFLAQVEEHADVLRKRAEAVRRFDLAKAAEYEAREAAKLDGFAKVADSQKLTFQAHLLELSPFSGNPVGEKIGDFVDGDARVRVFHNHSTNMHLYMANTPAGRLAFTIGAKP